MSIHDLNTQGRIVSAIERHGVLGMAVEPLSQSTLYNEQRALAEKLAKHGVDNPHGLIDRVTKEIAERGDADGLYENTDRVRALKLLERESNGKRER